MFVKGISRITLHLISMVYVHLLGPLVLRATIFHHFLPHLHCFLIHCCFTSYSSRHTLPHSAMDVILKGKPVMLFHGKVGGSCTSFRG